MNDYVQHNFPESFELATTVCDHLSHALHKPLEELEIGYLPCTSSGSAWRMKSNQNG